MANTLATPHWQEIRLLAEQGVNVSDLSRLFGVSDKTIYGRAASEDWLTPSKVRAKVEQLAQQARKNQKSPLLPGESLSEKSNSVLFETWETRAADLRNLAYGVAVQAIKESKGQIVIESASDLKHAVHVARQATGLLDTDAPQIQLSLFGNGDICGPAIMENQAIECETFQPVSEDTEFSW